MERLLEKSLPQLKQGRARVERFARPQKARSTPRARSENVSRRGAENPAN